MAERDRPQNAEPPSQADRTLLGVAPPRLESEPDSALRSPVFVRAGTSVADTEQPLPLPRMALPGRPVPPSVAPAAMVETAPQAARSPWAHVARTHPALWMVLAPAVVAVSLIGLLLAVTPAHVSKPAQSQSLPSKAAPATAERPAGAKPPSLAELEAKSPDALSSAELLQLEDGRAQRRVAEAAALREKLQKNPELAVDKPTQAELLRFSRDTETAPVTLAALAAIKSPVGPDLLYEVWAGTPAHSSATELARLLNFSSDVRPQASAALTVALDLRTAQSCESFKAILPRALKDGDRRSLGMLAKLGSKRGCGPRKTDDCFACLRGAPDELNATINAVKSRRPPQYSAP